MLEYGRGVHFNVDELMPCPCCGSESEIFATYFLWGSARAMNFGYSARCTNPECGVRIKLFRYLWEAIAVWNNRTGRHEEPIMYTYVGSNNPEREKKCLLIPHCPLCGSKAHIKLPPIGFLDPRGYYSVHCTNLYECGFTTREHDELPDGEVYGAVMCAVEEWNRRVEHVKVGDIYDES